MLPSVWILTVLGCNLAPILARPDGRIVGGELADIKDIPYQVSLQFNGQHGCGASIISNEWAITAAHCVKGVAVDNMQVRAGSSFHASGGSLHQVSEMHYHSNYGKPYRMDYDIAVIKVSPAFTFSDTVKAVSLQDNSVSAGTEAVVSGWGYTQENEGVNSPQLRKVSVPVIDRTYCDSEYYPDDISPRMICAGYEAGGKDACQNDSGGPLVANGNLVGVVSWGLGCAEADRPGVYTDVSVLRDWIKSTTGV
ncbi:trypsin-7 isoform X2 [Anabrus simplex]|uniref:trypsin-7 isoform X2 n=1 Tax=Anabrus simplex TaxID=316456 RepID=UPI0034DD7C35